MIGPKSLFLLVNPLTIIIINESEVEIARPEPVGLGPEQPSAHDEPGGKRVQRHHKQHNAVAGRPALKNKQQHRYGTNVPLSQSDNIRNNLKSADKKTKEMNRRNMCIKCSLYLVIIVLFVCIVVSLIYKLTK